MPTLEADDVAALAKALGRKRYPEAQRYREQWHAAARPEQLFPAIDGKHTHFFKAGRGSGKTRAAMEDCNIYALEHPEARIALIAPTAADVRDVLVEGESGLLAINPDISYEPSKRRATWPNGAMATMYSADVPARLRGPQHHRIYCDEIAVWEHEEQTWDMAMLGLRLGDDPRAIVTSTPRPSKLVRRLLADPTTVVTESTTRANAGNLAPTFLEQITRRYEGTRLGRQELEGELLEDVEGALWTYAMFDKLRVSEAPELTKVVIGIDPAVTSGEDSDETGIIVAGRDAQGHGYILADRSGVFSPDTWAQRAVVAYDEFEANRIVAEVNNGGDMVESIVRRVRKAIPYRAVRASRGKRVRAEPIAQLYEQGLVHHVGKLPKLEDQMSQWVPESTESPDRMDALVWALTELMVQKRSYGVRFLE